MSCTVSKQVPTQHSVAQSSALALAAPKRLECCAVRAESLSA
jgi:hypothetical protein